METNRKLPSRIAKIVFGLWGLLFVGLLVTHLIVSFHLKVLHHGEFHPSSFAVQNQNFLLPPEVKIIAFVLVVFLILIVWPKTRTLASKAFITVIGFAPLACGWYSATRASRTTDLANYTERFLETSAALLLGMAMAVCSLLLALAKSRMTKQSAPPVIPKTEAPSG